MSNLLRSDFYRLFKSKSFYICTAVVLFFSALTIFMLDWASNLASGEGNAMDATLFYKDGITYGMTAFASGNLQMILAIVTAIFVTAEFAHGTMKNVVSKGFSKIQIYLSKLITMIAATYMIILATLIVGTICATIVTGTLGDFTGEYVSLLLKTAGIELLLNAALTAVFVLVAMFIRNLGGVIAFNIIGIMSIGQLLFTILEYIVRSKIKFSEFSLTYNISFYLGNTADTGDYLRSILVGLIFLIVCTALGIFTFIKSDVK
ncbi:MAG: ABC transporter permease subunit [Herbinix sp.]|nr:ABC transporter permease subunit [Herbinix sp.]